MQLALSAAALLAPALVAADFTRLGSGCCRNDCGSALPEVLILRDPPGGKSSWSNGDCKRACRANVECTGFEIDKSDGSHGKCELQLNDVIVDDVDSESGRCGTGQISCWIRDADAAPTSLSSLSNNFERVGNGCCRNSCNQQPETAIILQGDFSNGDCKRLCRKQAGCTGFEIDKAGGVHGKCELQINSFIHFAVTDEGSRCGTSQISCWRRTAAGEPDASTAEEGSVVSDSTLAVPLVASIAAVAGVFVVIVVVRTRSAARSSKLAGRPKVSDEMPDYAGGFDQPVVYYENPLHESLDEPVVTLP